MRAGGVLIGIGSLICLAGVAVAGSALLRGARRWTDAREVPPQEVARKKWHQARSAAQAGVSAWNERAAELASAGR
jgi:hypothetical protein